MKKTEKQRLLEAAQKLGIPNVKGRSEAELKSAIQLKIKHDLNAWVALVAKDKSDETKSTDGNVAT